MRASRHLPAFVAMLLAAGSGAARAAAPGEWVSYRDAYRAMVVFEKYGKPKNFIQNHYQVMPREKGVSLEGVHLSLQGKTMQPEPAARRDRAHRVPVPEGGLRRERRAGAEPQGRPVTCSGRASRSSCRPTACTTAARPARRLRTGAGLAAPRRRVGAARANASACASRLRARMANRRCGCGRATARDGAAGGDRAGLQRRPERGFRVVNYRFADAPDSGQVVTTDAPLAIAALIE